MEIRLAAFSFNAFAENTYILYVPGNDCVVFDPGMSNQEEQEDLLLFLKKEQLTPKAVYLTHMHLDHILGLAFLQKEFGVPCYAHPLEQANFERAGSASLMWGVPFEMPEAPQWILDDGDTIAYHHSRLEVVVIPGHSPGHVGFYDKDQEWIIAGDVLFRESIGRTDLPGGSMEVLSASIQQRLYTLPENTTIFPGHGSETNVGWEKKNNPFVRVQR